jgi:hypothetical protein
MPISSVFGGAKAGALLGNQPALARRQGRWSARHGCIGRETGTAHEPRGTAQRSAGLGQPSTNLGGGPLFGAFVMFSHDVRGASIVPGVFAAPPPVTIVASVPLVLPRPDSVLERARRPVTVDANIDYTLPHLG